MKKSFIALLTFILVLMFPSTINAQEKVGDPIEVNVSQNVGTKVAGIVAYTVEPTGETYSEMVGDPINVEYVNPVVSQFSFVPESAGTYTVRITFDLSDEQGNKVSVEQQVKTYEIAEGSGGLNIDLVPSQRGDEIESDETLESQEDNNTDLKSLSVEGGVLEPEFDRGILEYTVRVAPTTTSITVAADPQDSRSTVSGTGQISLPAPDNRVILEVTAPNQFMAQVVLNIVSDNKVSDDSQAVFGSLESVELPSFNKATLTHPETGEKIEVLQNGEITLVKYDDSDDLYLYDAENFKVLNRFEYIVIDGKYYEILPFEEIIEGAFKTTVEIDGHYIEAYKLEEGDHIIHLKEFSKEAQYYSYDEETGTLEEVGSLPTVIIDETEEDVITVGNNNTLLPILIGAGVIVVISLIAFIILYMKNKDQGLDD